MRHSKNNSSICETTTLLSMSAVSAESTDCPSLAGRQHEQLAHKLQELELILTTTLAEGELLQQRQIQLQHTLAERKDLLHRIQRMPTPPQPEYSEDEMAETWRGSNRGGQSSGEASMGRTVKHHQKFYSAIQSPSLDYSPDRKYDQFTLHSYQKSKYLSQTTASTKSGLIRKQRDQIRLRDTPSYLSPRRRDFESIEDIWNGEGGRREETKSRKGLKTFL